MMISLEDYYSLHLKDTSEAEIREEMCKLKESIEELKKLTEIESLEFTSLSTRRSLKNQLYCTEKYLALTRKTLAERGAEDILAEYAKKAETFQGNLNFLKKITWEMGGHFGVGSIHIVEVKENNLLYSSKSGCGGMDPDYWGDFVQFTTEQMKSVPNTKTELLTAILPYCIGEWDDHYDDPEVSDGLEWSVTFDYFNEIPSTKLTGYHKTPDDFFDLHYLLFGDN